DQAGGTALAGVPPFRLPREVIDRDINGIVNENVELRLSTYVGKDVSIRQLHDDNDAVLVSAGCFEPNYPRIPGEDPAGVMAGIVRSKLGEPDKSGRRAPEPIPGSEFVVPCDTVLLALGQAPDTTWLAQDFPEFRVKRWNEIKVDRETYQTVVPKIFMGGDYRTAPTTIIEAVADGRSAAQQIARFLDENAVAVNVPEYHEVVTLRRSS